MVFECYVNNYEAIFIIILTDHIFGCNNVEYYSGEYKCKVEGIMAGTASVQQSEGVTIDTMCTLWTFCEIYVLLDDYLEKNHENGQNCHLLQIYFLTFTGSKPPVPRELWRFMLTFLLIPP